MKHFNILLLSFHISDLFLFWVFFVYTLQTRHTIHTLNTLNTHDQLCVHCLASIWRSQTHTSGGLQACLMRVTCQTFNDLWVFFKTIININLYSPTRHHFCCFAIIFSFIFVMPVPLTKTCFDWTDIAMTTCDFLLVADNIKKKYSLQKCPTQFFLDGLQNP